MWANRSGRSPKMSDVSKSLRLLTKNKRPWANRSGRSPKISEWGNRSFFWANRSLAHFFAKNKRFTQKTEFPALLVTDCYSNFCGREKGIFVWISPLVSLSNLHEPQNLFIILTLYTVHLGSSSAVQTNLTCFIPPPESFMLSYHCAV